MGTDLNAFYNQLQNNLAPYASNIGAVLAAVSFLTAFSIFFLLIVINKFTGEAISGADQQNAFPKPL